MRVLLMLMLVLFSLPTQAKPYIVSQTGGYAGLITLGAGYDWKYYSVNAAMGFAPALVAGENLWSTTMKNHFKYKGFHLGMAVHFSHDKDTFWRQPSKYPSGYYPPTGIYTGPYAGGHVKVENIIVFGEVTTLDYYLEMKARNPDYIKWRDIISLAFGVHYPL